jgi:hypothetical protein
VNAARLRDGSQFSAWLMRCCNALDCEAEMSEVQFFSDLTLDEQVETFTREMEAARTGNHRGYNANPAAMFLKWSTWVCDIAESKSEGR